MVDNGLKKKGKTRAQKKKKYGNSMNEEIEESKFMPALPFPEKQRREKLDKQMPAYAKFLKEILSKKRKVEETSVVKITEHCASINLMTLSIFRKLEGEIGEIRSIPLSLQLVDQTTIILEVIVEDMLVRVDKIVFPMDFILVNMEENREVPPILGRPFLATGRAIQDIKERQLMLRVGEERVVFKEGEMGALKKRAGESKHDKCGVYPKKA
ncbi:PREDICTED: uncharacterized protein LOC109227815 [Nicotiana attenuata]|uniref:uncharacterized protein LOC109227815 n=1 Tax=Nicotiana attenuata TaxID=49451 RepID=UPI000905783B|nr:PREDICTED: uncharacterized protein LOC109227815 [Nicotiana attenuata]